MAWTNYQLVQDFGFRPSAVKNHYPLRSNDVMVLPRRLEPNAALRRPRPCDGLHSKVFLLIGFYKICRFNWWIVFVATLVMSHEWWCFFFFTFFSWGKLIINSLVQLMLLFPFWNSLNYRFDMVWFGFPRCLPSLVGALNIIESSAFSKRNKIYGRIEIVKRSFQFYLEQ